MGEFDGIPGEVFFPIGVFDIKPNDIDWDVVNVEIFDNVSDVIFVVVVPTGLVVG